MRNPDIDRSPAPKSAATKKKSSKAAPKKSGSKR